MNRFVFVAVLSLLICSCGGNTNKDVENGPANEVLSKNVFESLSLKYEKISEFENGVAYIYDSNDRKGLIDNKGNILLDCVYENILDVTDIWGVGYAKLNGAWGLFNKEHQMITKCLYDSFRQPYEGLATLSISNRSMYGAIDTSNGAIVIPFEYENLGNYSEGLFAARIKEKGEYKAGYIDRNNQIVIPFIYSDAEDFSEGLAAVHKYENKTLNTILGPVRSEKCGFINKKGEVVIPFKFKWQTETIKFSEGLCAIGTDNKSNMIYETNRNSFIDTKGNIVITGLFTNAEPFENGVARVEKNDKYGYINKKGEFIIPCTYENYKIKEGCLCLVNKGVEYNFTYEGELIPD